MLVGTLTGDGNLLLSWGPKWSGEFAADQVAALKDAGDWVRKNEAAILGTRGGPWHPAEWGGSAHRDRSLYLHVISMPGGGTLDLEGLETKVVRAAIHGGAELAFHQDGSKLRVTIPSELHDPLCTVVELTLDEPVTTIIAPTLEESIFNDPAYGRVISETISPEVIAADDGKNPRSIIDLGKSLMVRGIRIEQPVGVSGIAVALSLDGEAWEEITRSGDAVDIWEIPVTRFEAGAHVPGREARFVKIERRLDAPGALRLRAVRIHGE